MGPRRLRDLPRKAVERSLENLGVDVIDCTVPPARRWIVYGQVMVTLATLQQEGLIRAVGISNASVEEIEIARQVLGDGNLASVQNEFSPKHPGSIDEAPLRTNTASRSSHGARSAAPGAGPATSATASRHSERSAKPRRQPAAGRARLGAALEPDVIPIPGARRATSIADSAKAADLELSTDEVARLSRSVGIAD